MHLPHFSLYFIFYHSSICNHQHLSFFATLTVSTHLLTAERDYKTKKPQLKKLYRKRNLNSPILETNKFFLLYALIFLIANKNSICNSNFDRKLSE